MALGRPKMDSYATLRLSGCVRGPRGLSIAKWAVEDEVNSELVGGRLQNRGARFRAGSWDGLGRRAHQRFDFHVEVDGEFKVV